jgi:flagellar biosynthesis/type III secretory pathway protein FliH
VQEANKFLFDVNNFDHAAGYDPDAPVTPTYSEDDLAVGKSQAFAEGEKKGLADGLASRDQQIVALTQKLTTDIATLMSAEAGRASRFEQELIRLARAMFTQAFPILNDHFGWPQIEDSVKSVLGSLEESSSIIIEVSPQDQDELSTRLKGFLSQHVGQVSILPQSELAPGSFRMRWKDGGAIRDIETLKTMMIDALGRALAEPEQKKQN